MDALISAMLSLACVAASSSATYGFSTPLAASARIEEFELPMPSAEEREDAATLAQGVSTHPLNKPSSHDFATMY
jgi:hypothetical protein